MIRKNTILSLLVTCGLLLVGSAAYAQVNGQCQSIGARSLGLVNQIVLGGEFDLDKCLAFGAVQVEFMMADCSLVDETAFGKIVDHGASCNLASKLCDAVFICSGGMEIEECDGVPACTIP